MIKRKKGEINMSKYIDSEKLIAEIERRMECYDRDGCEPNDGKWVELVTMKHFIESLQQEQPEVDLDRATIESYSLPLLNRQVSREELDKFARHFYELGLSTMRKRLADPEYNREAIEKMKSEYPVDESNAKKL